MAMALAGGVAASDAPAILSVEIKPGQDAAGWAATGEQLLEDVEVGGTSGWPPGRLDVIGAHVSRAPSSGVDHPYLVLEGIMTIRVHRAEYLTPSERGKAVMTWPETPGSGQITLENPHTPEDGQRTTSALAWMQGDFKRGAGRPRGTGAFADGAAFRSEATAQVRLLLGAGKKATQDKVADALGVSLGRMKELCYEHIPEGWATFRDGAA